MSDFQRHIVVGRLTRDPELKYSQRGNAYVHITVASNVFYMTSSGKQEATLFADYVFFGARAEAIAKNFRKADKILVEGKAYTDQWDDPQTGVKRTKIKFIGDNFSFIDNKTREKEGENTPTRSPQPSYAVPPRKPVVSPGGARGESSRDATGAPLDSDIPF